MSPLLAFINSAINTGVRQIVVPRHLVENASDEQLQEARRLCKLNGVELEVGD